MRTIVTIFAVLMSVGCSSETPEQKEAKACGDRVRAYAMSMQFVRRQLVSPSSARFPDTRDQDVTLTHVNPGAGCTHKVEAYVESENRLGVVIRTRYSITMTKTPGEDRWYGESLRMR